MLWSVYLILCNLRPRVAYIARCVFFYRWKRKKLQKSEKLPVLRNHPVSTRNTLVRVWVQVYQSNQWQKQKSGDTRDINCVEDNRCVQTREITMHFCIFKKRNEGNGQLCASGHGERTFRGERCLKWNERDKNPNGIKGEHVSTHTHTHTHTHTQMYICVYVCMHVCVCVCERVCPNNPVGHMKIVEREMNPPSRLVFTQPGSRSLSSDSTGR